MKLKIVPKKMMGNNNGKWGMLRVVQIQTHPKNSHPTDCPLIQNCVAMEIHLEGGWIRWIGANRAFIGSDLQMHFEPISSNDEIINKWEDSDEN